MFPRDDQRFFRAKFDRCLRGDFRFMDYFTDVFGFDLFPFDQDVFARFPEYQNLLSLKEVLAAEYGQEAAETVEKILKTDPPYARILSFLSKR